MDLKSINVDSVVSAARRVVDAGIERLRHDDAEIIRDVEAAARQFERLDMNRLFNDATAVLAGYVERGAWPLRLDHVRIDLGSVSVQLGSLISEGRDLPGNRYRVLVFVLPDGDQ